MRYLPIAVQNFIPMLCYQDAPAALLWLGAVFGAEPGLIIEGESGTLSHAELEIEGQRLMIASPPTPAYDSPRSLRARDARAAQAAEVPYIMDGVVVFVHDLDATLTRGQAQGAKILSEIEDGFPARRFRLEDPEGHRWYVMQRP